ncbi:MAG: heparan-alpha-glucosaminide N-acetyltransferase domain-containing protein [Bacilli bacterium]|jgi:uncharacterized membrane protein
MNKDALSIKSNKSISAKLPRIWEIDFLRGFLILLMVIDHFIYDWAYVVPNFFGFLGVRPSWVLSLCHDAQIYWNDPYRIAARYAILCLFFLISGISCFFSKNNLKRGLIVLGVGSLIAILSFIFSLVDQDPTDIMFFGAISCFGFSILGYFFFSWLIKKIFRDDRYWKWFALGLGLAIVFIGFCIGGIGYCPDVANLSWDNWYLIILGVRKYGADCLGLFPMMGFMFLGGFLGELLYSQKMRERRVRFDKRANAITFPISFIGRHSMWVYLLHQIILIAIIGAILLSNGFYLRF